MTPLFALLVMVCAATSTVGNTDAGSCRLYEPPWAIDLTREECSAVKADLAGAVIGGGVRFECVEIDTD